MGHTFIIAEAGVNHNGSLEIAKKLIDVAVAAGADAVKFQTFKADTLLTTDAQKAAYQMKNTATAESQYTMIKQLELSGDDHAILIDYCRHHHIQFLSTAFDLESMDLLLRVFNLPLLKIASGEITNHPLLLKAACSQKPIILSTGMSTLGDIEAALSVLAFGYLHDKNMKPTLHDCLDAYHSRVGQKKLQEKITLLHCVTDYPAPFSAVNLKALDTLRHAFHLRVGYSDHTQGIEIPISAVALGSVIIEKHFTLDRTLPGPDHAASLEPNELKAMITAIRHVELAMGEGQKIPTTTECHHRLVARKSLVALKNIKKGDIFTEKNIGLKRPGTGISAIYFWDWLDKVSSRDYIENELIQNI